MYNTEICTKCDTQLTWAESAKQIHDQQTDTYYEVFEDVQYCEKCDLEKNHKKEKE
jgi:hypothetical protein|tara:strand:+ start:887 stop:1054 length:168 start_codon:yes stop_codon:yes gene_type:complete